MCNLELKVRINLPTSIRIVALNTEIGFQHNLALLGFESQLNISGDSRFISYLHSLFSESEINHTKSASVILGENQSDKNPSWMGKKIIDGRSY